MLRNIIFALVITAGCGGKKSDNNAGSGSAATGSSMAGSGSSMAGSGSATAGSGSAGSGSAMAGSGSAGSGSAGSGSAATGSDAGSAAEAPPPDDFLKKTKEDKMKIMKEKVMPAMAKAFKGHDAKKFAKFNCKSCHGKTADDKTWKMPNPDLPPLDFEALQAGKQEPKMAKFMAEVVSPDMAKILELRHFDPKEPEKGGFGCLACHVQKK